MIVRCFAVLVYCLSLGFLSSSEDSKTGNAIPIIDVSSLYGPSFPHFFLRETIEQIGNACRDFGFFYITAVEGGDHNSWDFKRIEQESEWFFSQSVEQKRKIDMSLGGSAWRGYFAVGDELTSGIPDMKEGIYFGTESNDTSKPLHGHNQYPTKAFFSEVDSLGYPIELFHVIFKESVPRHMKTMRNIAERLMQAIALSLDLDPAESLNFTDPTELFRIFSYPAYNASADNSLENGAVKPVESQGVGEHTDYGYLTILYQDLQGGLQVRDPITREWMDVAPVFNTYVVNLGDALEHYTGGLYRATPHRVRRKSPSTSTPQTPRLSMPYFFDPNFETDMVSIADRLSPRLRASLEERRNRDRAWAEQHMVSGTGTGNVVTDRWDKADVTKFSGKYGDYLLNKVSKVFPHLFKDFMTGGTGAAKIEEDARSRVLEDHGEL